ncbi:MAG: helix-turn-helix transcriptional regulator [Pedobacter sp.]|uniref:helix-turn-helix domain-containing protein n=1 Tax=Pedobacter sp. TaxID=1411316 RepID=UPI002809929B|nr:helix-turn-helix transcriptional regulator [Pedobacter sp.]MDQ8005180.1 helix-turn-helix transcriptional regulator [Pedobacter sp.]
MKNNELNNQAFANYVRKVRRDKELSQLCMANLMNISQNAYCLIENGHTKITLAHIQ